jgi:transposase
MDKSFFIHPSHSMQKRYEALRAAYVEGLSSQEIAEKFGYTLYSFKSLKRDSKEFTAADFFQELKRGPKSRNAKTLSAKERIIELRKKNYSVVEIHEELQQENISVSESLIQDILREEGFGKLFRRTHRERLEILQQERQYPQTSDVDRFGERKEVSTTLGGVFLFLPFILKLRLHELFTGIGFYGTKTIPAISYLIAYLGLKLLGKERLCHINDFSFDYGLGVFAGLNVLPKSAAISSYSYRHSPQLVKKLLKGFTKSLQLHGYLKGQNINPDFHSIPHYGEESSLENHWVPTRGKSMKSVLSFFAQDLDTTFLCYSNGDILREKQNDEVLEFLNFYEDSTGLLPQRLVFDSKLTTYEHLNRLNQRGILFITLKRRGKNFLKEVGQITNWKSVRLDNVKRKYRHLQVAESFVSLKNYDGQVRQMIVKGAGRELPMSLITNDMNNTPKEVITFYSYRWRVENNIQENVDFFNLNTLSSPVVVKVDFDIAMTLIANTLYKLLAQQTKYFNQAKPKTISRNFIDVNTHIEIHADEIKVRFAKKAYNPILMDWLDSLDEVNIPWWQNRKLIFEFE